MRIVYFTYVQSTEYLRFYYKPTVKVDGVVVIDKGQSFVYFKEPQHNVQETLRIIDKDIELGDCRFSYRLEDLLFYMSKPDISRVCRHTTILLGNLFSIFQSESFTEKNMLQLSQAYGNSYTSFKNNRVFKRPLSFLN